MSKEIYIISLIILYSIIIGGLLILKGRWEQLSILARRIIILLDMLLLCLATVLVLYNMVVVH